MSYLDNVASLFPSGGIPPLYSDSADVRGIFAELGMDTRTFTHLEQAAGAVREAIVVPAFAETTPDTGYFHRMLGDAAVLVIPLVSFCPERESVKYLAKMLDLIDFQQSCARNEHLLTLFETQPDPIEVLTGADSKLLVTLGDDLQIMLPKLAPTIDHGEWVSIAQFIEVGIIPKAAENSFSVTGTVICEGAAVAHHKVLHQRARPIAQEAWSALHAMREAGGFPLRVTVRESEVLSIDTPDGRDISPSLITLTDEVFQGSIIELAFASATITTDIDWFVNSQINEAAGGVHLALGTGVRAAHIDLVAPRAQVLV